MRRFLAIVAVTLCCIAAWGLVLDADTSGSVNILQSVGGVLQLFDGSPAVPGGPTNNLVLWHQYINDNDPTADASGNSNTGAVNSATWTNDAGIGWSYYRFGGLADITVPENGTLKHASGTSFSGRSPGFPCSWVALAS